MKLRGRWGRRGLSFFGVITALAVLAGPAGANSGNFCGVTYPSGTPVTFDWYFAGNYSGQIQCAGKWSSYLYDPLWGFADGYSRSAAGKDVFCSNSFPLPANWIVATVAVQELSGGTWVTIKTGANAYNAGGSSQAGPATVRATTYANNRVVTGHSVISAGAWQNTIYTISC